MKTKRYKWLSLIICLSMILGSFDVVSGIESAEVDGVPVSEEALSTDPIIQEEGNPEDFVTDESEAPAVEAEDDPIEEPAVIETELDPIKEQSVAEPAAIEKSIPATLTIIHRLVFEDQHDDAVQILDGLELGQTINLDDDVINYDDVVCISNPTQMKLSKEDASIILEYNLIVISEFEK